MTQIDATRRIERLAHELSNLLAVIMGQAEYLLHEDDHDDPGDRQECLTTIRHISLTAREKIREIGEVLNHAGESAFGSSEGCAAQIWQRLFAGALAGVARGERLRFDVAVDGSDLVIDVPAEGIPIPELLIAAAGGCLEAPEVAGSPDALRIRLPLAPAPEPDTVRAQGERRDRVRAARRLLVVDDEEGVRDTLELLLRQAGHEVHTAASGAEGIELYRQRRFDCVMTDFAMPGLSGLTVSRAIKDHDPNAYVVLLTGVEYAGKAGELKAAGVDRLVVKPLTREEVLTAVDPVAPTFRPGP